MSKILYQVRVTIDHNVEEKWKEWMITKHIPDVLDTGLIASHSAYQDQLEPHTYHFQYIFASQADFDTYQSDHAPELKKHTGQLFPNQFTASRIVAKSL